MPRTATLNEVKTQLKRDLAQCRRKRRSIKRDKPLQWYSDDLRLKGRENGLVTALRMVENMSVPRRPQRVTVSRKSCADCKANRELSAQCKVEAEAHWEIIGEIREIIGVESGKCVVDALREKLA